MKNIAFEFEVFRTYYGAPCLIVGFITLIIVGLSALVVAIFTYVLPSGSL